MNINDWWNDDKKVVSTPSGKINNIEDGILQQSTSTTKYMIEDGLSSKNTENDKSWQKRIFPSIFRREKKAKIIPKNLPSMIMTSDIVVTDYQAKRNIVDIDHSKILEWEISPCAINGEEVVNTDIRLSYTNKHRFILNIKGMKDFCQSLNISVDDVSSGWSLIKYIDGCKFDKHTDHEGDYTFLLFPANQECVGGILNIDNQNGEDDIKVYPDTLKKPLLIAFKIKCSHEVTEVLSGERYVYKRSFSCDK